MRAGTFLAALGLAHAADAAIAFQHGVDLGNNNSAPGTSFSGTAGPNSASNMIIAMVLNQNDDSTTFTATWNGVAMTEAVCSGGTANQPNSAGLPHLFYLINPAIGQHPLTVTASQSASFSVMEADYSGVGAFERCQPNYGTSPVTTTVTTSHPNDWAIIEAAGYNTHSAGTGDTLRMQDVAFSQFALFDSNGSLTAGNHSFTTSLSVANSINHLVAIFTPQGPTPTSITFNPSSASLLDTALSGATVAGFTVGTSDGSTYTGSNSVSPSTEFAVPGTGSGNVTLSRNLTGNDDGIDTASVSACENSACISKTISVSVQPVTVSGIPFSQGWKNADPGATTLFVAGSAYTINQIVLRVETPTSGAAALLDVYRAPQGVACNTTNAANASLIKLHTGDLSGSSAAGQNQVAPLVASGLTMSIGDSICLVTQQPYPTNGTATLTVTAHSATE